MTTNLLVMGISMSFSLAVVDVTNTCIIQWICESLIDPFPIVKLLGNVSGKVYLTMNIIGKFPRESLESPSENTCTVPIQK